MAENTKYISYRRVSTEEQQNSGLGLDAQYKSIVQVFGNPILDFVEAETGADNERPELLKAIQKCKELGATLVVSRQDRLSRDTYFISLIMRQGIDFKSADNPNATDIIKHIMAAIAEDERKTISLRVKSALDIKKEQLRKEGKRLGCPDVTKNGRTVQEVILENRKKRVYAKPDPFKVNTLKTLHKAGTTIKDLQETARHLFGKSLSRVTIYNYLKQ